MDIRIRIVTIGGSAAILLFIFELVRRRRLKEEYSVLWIATALVLLVLSVWFSALERLTKLIGGVAPTSTLFFFGLLFVVVLLLHFSVRISAMERRFTAMIQEVGLLSLETEESRGSGRPQELPEASDRVPLP